MDHNEHLLSKIDERTRKQGEDLAWMRGRLEEVHARAAQIPILVDDIQTHRFNMRVVWFFIIAGIVLNGPSVYVAIRNLLQ